jgi:hypothetical protein
MFALEQRHRAVRDITVRIRLLGSVARCNYFWIPSLKENHDLPESRHLRGSSQPILTAGGDHALCARNSLAYGTDILNSSSASARAKPYLGRMDHSYYSPKRF